MCFFSFHSILCIKELGQLSLQSSQVTSPKEEPPPEATDVDNNDISSKQSQSSPGVSVDYQDPSEAQHAGWIDGLLGCLRPVWTIIGKAAANEIKGKQGELIKIVDCKCPIWFNHNLFPRDGLI